jgi:hypothetical protein
MMPSDSPDRDRNARPIPSVVGNFDRKSNHFSITYGLKYDQECVTVSDKR